MFLKFIHKITKKHYCFFTTENWKLWDLDILNFLHQLLEECNFFYKCRPLVHIFLLILNHTIDPTIINTTPKRMINRKLIPRLNRLDQESILFSQEHWKVRLLKENCGLKYNTTKGMLLNPLVNES